VERRARSEPLRDNRKRNIRRMLRIAVDSDFGLRKVWKKKWKVTTGHVHHDFVARFKDMIDTKRREINFVRRVECGCVIMKVAARIQDAIDHRYRGDQVGCIASESVLDWSQEGWDASSRLNGDAAATGGSSGRKLESIEKVRFHYGAGQRKCVGSDQTGFRPSGRALGRHRDPRLIGDAVVNAFKPMVEPKKKLCPQKKRFRSSDIARCRRMAQAADIHFKE